MGSGKLATYLVLMSGATLMFYFTGLIGQGDTINGELLSLLLEPQDYSSPGQAFFDNIRSILTLSTGLVTAVVVGFATRDLGLALKIPFALAMFTLLWDTLFVFVVVGSTINYIIATLLLSPLFVLFGLTVVEYLFL